MLVIEHDMPPITSLADRTIALDQGFIAAEATPSEVIRHAAVVRPYFVEAADRDFVGRANPRYGPTRRASRRTRRARARAG